MYKLKHGNIRIFPFTNVKNVLAWSYTVSPVIIFFTWQLYLFLPLSTIYKKLNLPQGRMLVECVLTVFFCSNESASFHSDWCQGNLLTSLITILQYLSHNIIKSLRKGASGEEIVSHALILEEGETRGRTFPWFFQCMGVRDNNGFCTSFEVWGALYLNKFCLDALPP